MNDLIKLDQDGKIGTKALLDMLNQERSKADASPVRMNDFHARVVDELEGEHYENFVVQNPNKTETTCYRLTPSQALLVCMRESKGVRRAVKNRLERMQSQTHVIPQNYAEALQLAADQAKQLEIAAPKADFYDRVVERETLINATQVAQKVGLSAVMMNRALDEIGGVYSKSTKRGRVFIQEFIHKGYGILRMTESGHAQPLFTTAGEARVIELLTNEGCI